MTNQPATAAAPVPATQSLDLTPGSNPSPAVGAALEKVEWTGVLEVGRRQFNLVAKLPAITMVKLQQAQDSGQFLEIIEAIPLLVQHDQREALKAYLLDDPTDEADIIELDDIVDALSNGLEQIAARPTAR